MSNDTATQPGLNISNELEELKRELRRRADGSPELPELDEFETRESTAPFNTVPVTPESKSGSHLVAEDPTDARSVVEQALMRMSEVKGFMGAVAILPGGELLAEVGPERLRLKEVGPVTNEVLSRARAAATMMNVGGDNVSIDVLAREAHLMMRCAVRGDAHVHLCFVMALDANIGMGKIWARKIADEVLEAVG